MYADIHIYLCIYVDLGCCFEYRLHLHDWMV